LGVALPGIFVWGLGILFYAIYLLYSLRGQLHKLEIREKFGFLYNGYKRKHVYWEILILYRKIALVIVFDIIYNLCNIT
jgi:hypothetical protein